MVVVVVVLVVVLLLFLWQMKLPKNHHSGIPVDTNGVPEHLFVGIEFRAM
jgi:hypothetical protein